MLRATRVDHILRWVKGPWILDVGCTGHSPEPDSPYWLHGQLCKNFPHVVGIDISEENVKYLTALGYEELYVGSAENFTLPYKFDTIIAADLIEHLSNPGLFLERAREHLKPAGRLILTTHHPFSLMYIAYAIFKFPKTCSNPQHTCWFCPQTLKELTHRFGFRVVHWDLIEDYRFDVSSPRYWLFVRLIRLFGWLIPRIWRLNSMVFVLENEAY